MIKGIEAGQVFKQPFESQTSLFQETYIRLTIGEQFFLKVEHDVLGTLLLMPGFKGLSSFECHGLRHVVIA